MHADQSGPTPHAPGPRTTDPSTDLDALTAAVARLEGTADALDARLERRPGPTAGSRGGQGPATA